MDAHVTADATEQWIRLALRDDVPFDPAAIAARVPDCGYQLRRIEVDAIGTVDAGAFVFESSGQRFALVEAPERQGRGRLVGSFEMPIEEHPELTADTFSAAPASASGPAR